MNLYFDGTATTRPSELAIETFTDVSSNTWYNPSAVGYEGASAAAALLKEAREIIAKCIFAEPEQIFFTSGATEGANWVINSMVHNGDVVLVSKGEHPAVYNAATHATMTNAHVSAIPIKDDGTIDENALYKRLESYTSIHHNTLVAIMDCNNEIGVFNNRLLPEFIHLYDRAYHLCDMTQTFAHSLNYDVSKFDVDFAIASAHKFNAFKGTGFLYAKNPELLSPFMFGGHQEFEKRPGTENVAGIYAMALQFRESIANRLRENIDVLRLKTYLKTEAESHGWIVHGSPNSLPHIVSVAIPGVNASKLIAYLGMDGICLSAGSACNSTSAESKPSRVLTACGISEEEALSTIRISLDQDHTIDDIKYLIKRIEFHLDRKENT